MIWTTSDEEVLPPVSGLVNLPQAETEVELTADINVEGYEPKTFNVKVFLRDIE